jgi:hypothetical protein
MPTNASLQWVTYLMTALINTSSSALLDGTCKCTNNNNQVYFVLQAILQYIPRSLYALLSVCF